MTKKILLVDDNVMNRMLFKSLLSQDSYLVDTAEGGDIALEKLHDITYDLVLLDWIMPHPDGAAVLKILKHTPKWAALPVIILTGLDSDDEISIDQNDTNQVVIVKKSSAPAMILEQVQHILTQHEYIA